MIIHNNIKQLRKSLNLTQTAFAKKLGMTLGGVQFWEAGKSEIKQSSINLICLTFGISEQWLRTGKGEMLITHESNFQNGVKKDASNEPLAPYGANALSKEKEKAINLIKTLDNSLIHKVLSYIEGLYDASATPAAKAAKNKAQ